MESPEQFNPYNSKYKEFEDLPEDQKEKFKSVREGGFVKKEAIEEEEKAQEIANMIWAKMGIDNKGMVERKERKWDVRLEGYSNEYDYWLERATPEDYQRAFDTVQKLVAAAKNETDFDRFAKKVGQIIRPVLQSVDFLILAIGSGFSFSPTEVEYASKSRDNWEEFRKRMITEKSKLDKLKQRAKEKYEK